MSRGGGGSPAARAQDRAYPDPGGLGGGERAIGLPGRVRRERGSSRNRHYSSEWNTLTVSGAFGGTNPAGLPTRGLGGGGRGGIRAVSK